MSGTNHSMQLQHSLQPKLILVRPQMGENIGASARAMLNFGLSRLTLVAPRDGWPNPSAIALASGAAKVLDHVEVKDDLTKGLQGVDYVFATTARERSLTKEVLSPKEAMRRCFELTQQMRTTAILFGPERSGLESEDLVMANALVSIPVNPSFGSLNLAQSVLLLAYEWQLAHGEPESARMDWGPGQVASQDARAHLLTSLEERLDEIGFFWPKEKAASMRIALRNMIGRLPLSDIDVRMLHGVFRSLWRGEKFKNKRDSR